jgi:hypothetical protein
MGTRYAETSLLSDDKLFGLLVILIGRASLEIERVAVPHVVVSGNRTPCYHRAVTAHVRSSEIFTFVTRFGYVRLHMSCSTVITILEATWGFEIFDKDSCNTSTT